MNKFEKKMKKNNLKNMLQCNGVEKKKKNISKKEKQIIKIKNKKNKKD